MRFVKVQETGRLSGYFFIDAGVALRAAETGCEGQEAQQLARDSLPPPPRRRPSNQGAATRLIA